MLVYPDGGQIGTIGGGEMEARVRAAAIEAMATRRSTDLDFDLLDPQRGDPGVCGGSVSVHLEVFMPKPHLVVIGCGHVGAAVVELAHWLGFRVTAIDDRVEVADPERLTDANVVLSGPFEDSVAQAGIDEWTHVVLLTRNTAVDAELLPLVLDSPARSIGVMGSARRWATTRPAARRGRCRFRSARPGDVAGRFGDRRRDPGRDRPLDLGRAGRAAAPGAEPGVSPTARPPQLCVLRGGGDLATGVAWRLTRAGWPVVVCELTAPLTIRRTVAVSTAVTEGAVDIEGIRAVLAPNAVEAAALAADGVVGVMISPELPSLDAAVVIDARLAKRNIDTTIDDAPLVIGLGPGFTAGVDCHAVIETQRGHHLGRVLWSGTAAPNTGTPGVIAGKGAERVLRAPTGGAVRWRVGIGDAVCAGEPMGAVGGVDIAAPFAGTVRGLIAEQVPITEGLKIADVDPRHDPTACQEISDKALAVGGGVVEAVLARSRPTWSNP